MDFSFDWKASELDKKMKDMLIRGGRERIMREVMDAEVQRLTQNPTPEVIALVEDHSQWAPSMRTDEGNAEINHLRHLIADASYENVISNDLRNGRIPFDRESRFQEYVSNHAGNYPHKVEELLLAKGKEHFQQYMQISDQSFNALTLAEFIQEWERFNILKRLDEIDDSTPRSPYLRMRLSRRMEEPDVKTREMRFEHEQRKLKVLEGKMELYLKTGVKPNLGRWM